MQRNNGDTNPQVLGCFLLVDAFVVGLSKRIQDGDQEINHHGQNQFLENHSQQRRLFGF